MIIPGVIRCAQPLHRDDLGAVQIRHPGQTRPHGFAVHHHRAGAALALAVAGLFGSGQPQLLPQQIQQHGLCIHD
jgi:hypothetical protein